MGAGAGIVAVAPASASVGVASQALDFFARRLCLRSSLARTLSSLFLGEKR